MLEQNLQSRNNEFSSPSVNKQNKFESPQEVLFKISGVKVLNLKRETAGFRGESEQEAGFLQGEGLSIKGDNLRTAALDLQTWEGERGEQDADRGLVLPDQGPHRTVEVLQDEFQRGVFEEAAETDRDKGAEKQLFEKLLWGARKEAVFKREELRIQDRKHSAVANEWKKTESDV